MSQPASLSLLSQLDAGVRDQLLDWLVDFDSQWQSGAIESTLETLPETLQPWRGVALSELVRVDIVKQWQSGAKVRIDAYLKRFPELGTAETVAPELIVAEVEARKLAGKRMSGKELLERFPQQAQAVRQLVSGSSQTASGISRQSAPTIAGRETVSVAPGETFPRSPGGLRGKLAPGSQFGPGDRYRIVRQLGGGGMGAVYLATDSSLGNRKVAIKVPHFSPADGPEMLERFQREAALLATISHPNLGIVYDVNECDGVNFLVMEYISGMSLADYSEKHPLTPDKAVWVVRKIAQALQAAHAKGVVHRDLKPDNIMLARDGQPKVIDFGLAVNVEGGGTRATQSGMTMGTPEYMPLEQVTGDLTKIGPRSDVYSLGIVLYKLLTGTVPFTGNSPLAVGVKLFNETAPSPATHNPDLGPRLSEIVLKAIAKEPEGRFESMKEFSNALAEYSQSLQIAVATQVGGHLTQGLNLSADVAVQKTGPVDLSEGEAQSLPTPTEINVTAFVEDGGGVAAAQSRRWRRTKSPVKTVVAAVIGMAALFGVIFTFKSGDTTVTIKVDASDVAVTFHDRTVTLNDGRQEIAVTPGTHSLHVAAGDQEFDIAAFSVGKGQSSSVVISRVRDELRVAVNRVDIARRSLTASVPPASAVESGQNAAESLADSSSATAGTQPKRVGRQSISISEIDDMIKANVAAGNRQALLQDDYSANWTQAGPKVTRFSVQDDVLTARNTGPPGFFEHLLSHRRDYGNFQLSYEFNVAQAERPGFVLVRVDPSPVTFGGMRGYQLMLASGETDGGGQRTVIASIELVSRVRKGLNLITAEPHPLRPDGWVKVDIVVNDWRIVVSLDGKPVLDYVDEGATFEQGALALKYIPGSVNQYRSLTIVELPGLAPVPGTKQWRHQEMTVNKWNERWGLIGSIDGTKWFHSCTDLPGFWRKEFRLVKRDGDFIQLEALDENSKEVLRIFADRVESGPSESQLKVAWRGEWLND